MRVLLLMVLAFSPSLFAQGLLNNERVEPGPFVIALPRQLTSLNPVRMRRDADLFVRGLMARGLVKLDDHGRFVPVLLEHLPQALQASARNEIRPRQYLCRLRADTKWGDGAPLSADDVVFSWQLARLSSDPDLRGIVKVAAAQDSDPPGRTFIVEMDPSAALLPSLSKLQLLPRHIEAKALEASGAHLPGYERLSVFSSKPTEPGLYNGPYLPVEISRGRHLMLETNPHFYGQKPTIERIKLIVMPIAEQLITEATSGKVDLIPSLVSPSELDLWLTIERRRVDDMQGLGVVRTTSNVVEYLVFNRRSALLKDARVRRALAFGIDKRALVMAVAAGNYTLADRFLPPADPRNGLLPVEPPRYPFSLDAAVKLLDEAGWKLNSKGIRVRGGRELSIQMVTNANHRGRARSLEILKHGWQQLGIKVRLSLVDPKRFFEDSVGKGAFKDVMMVATQVFPWTDLGSFFHSDAIPSQNKVGWNLSRLSDPRADRILGALREVRESSAITELFRIINEDAALIPLYYRANFAIASARLKQGFRPPVYSSMVSSLSVEDWRL